MKKLTLAAVLGALAITGIAHAAENPASAPVYEVTANSNISYTHYAYSNLSSSSVYSVAGGISYFWMPQVELGTSINFGYTSLQVSHVTALTVLVGPTFNFLGNPENAFYVDAKAGVLFSGNGQYAPNYTLFAYFVGAGKRFDLGGHVTWKPEVAFVGNSADGSSGASAETQFQVIPFQFSLLF
jgi:hypothetical protein